MRAALFKIKAFDGRTVDLVSFSLDQHSVTNPDRKAGQFAPTLVV